MSYAVLSVVAIITLVTFVWLTFTLPRREYWFFDFASVGLMVGFVGVALFTFALTPNPSAVVNLVWYYSPHAYNLILWPILAIVILRPRFGPQFMGAFVLVYGLSEVLWNAVAYARFGGLQSPFLDFMNVPYWHVFFMGVIAAVVVSYFLVRPQITPNLTWAFFTGFLFVYAVVAGIPTYVDSPYPVPLYVYAWELMWQGAVWIFIYGTFWKRKPGTAVANTSTPLRPSPRG